MSARKKKLPIGIENFEEMITEDYYFVDKTLFIRDLLYHGGKVNLFTRPRRFGKSLNMNMLSSFFEINGNPQIFEDLAIAEEKELCEQYMGQFPVISISLKGIHENSYQKALELAAYIICAEAGRMPYLLESKRLLPQERELFAALLKRDMSDTLLQNSLKILSELLHKHYGRKVILLIDEYDVPLAKAYERGYYDEMAVFIRNLFDNVLKTNHSLKFAVLTGCMRISKESIFTGLNNLSVFSTADMRFDEYFGFTNQEVLELLEYYQLVHKYEEIKTWYDGYQFGSEEIYCPWDVINYCDNLRADRDAKPQNYWLNTSGNDIIRQFIRMSEHTRIKNEIEQLVAGKTILKTLHQELTYKDMYSSPDYIWDILFTTGYLTQRGRQSGKQFCLAIPNMEIREIFTEQIIELFQENVRKDGDSLNRFCCALKNGDVKGVESCFGEYLRKTISIRDTFVKNDAKESFYHGILIGILGIREDWGVSSNKESGDGYSDILIEIEHERLGIVIEVKYASNGNLEAACKHALVQIEKNRYDDYFWEEGMEHVLKYGFACYKKRCMVMTAH